MKRVMAIAGVGGLLEARCRPEARSDAAKSAHTGSLWVPVDARRLIPPNYKIITRKMCHRGPSAGLSSDFHTAWAHCCPLPRGSVSGVMGGVGLKIACWPVCRSRCWHPTGRFFRATVLLADQSAPGERRHPSAGWVGRHLRAILSSHDPWSRAY
jgi:hypothetical protein